MGERERGREGERERGRDGGREGEGGERGSSIEFNMTYVLGYWKVSTDTQSNDSKMFRLKVKREGSVYQIDDSG